MSRPRRLDVDAVGHRLARQQAGLEEPLDLVAGHRAERVARQPRQLGVRVPAQHGRQVAGSMTAQVDAAALDLGRVPVPVGVASVHRRPMLSQRAAAFLTIGVATPRYHRRRCGNGATSPRPSRRPGARPPRSRPWPGTSARCPTTSCPSPPCSCRVARSRRRTRARPAWAGGPSRMSWRELADGGRGSAPAPPPLGLGAAYDRSSDLGQAVGDILESAGYRARRHTAHAARRSRTRSRPSRRLVVPRPRARSRGRCCERCDADDRTGRGQGAQRRAAHRSPAGPPGGGHRERVRARPRRGPVGRDAHRRHRPDRAHGPRRRAGTRRS